MTEFSSYDPEWVEVSGEVIQSFVLGFPEDMRDFARTSLEQHGIHKPNPDLFYRAQPLLDAMKEVAQRLGRNWMTRIGERIALSITLPPEWDTLEAAFRGLNTAYHSKYRGEEIGNWSFFNEGLKGGLMHGRVVSTNHYCCTFDRGVLEGFAKRFRPMGITDALVRHDDTQPCRKTGADSCTYVITWG
jgi:hypothetical protein